MGSCSTNFCLPKHNNVVSLALSLPYLTRVGTRCHEQHGAPSLVKCGSDQNEDVTHDAFTTCENGLDDVT